MDNNESVEVSGEPAGPKYRLSLKAEGLEEGEGFEVDRVVGEDVALQVLATVMGGNTGGGRASASRPQVPRPMGRGRSLREYLDDVEPKRNVDKILAVASYLESEKGAETFTRDEVRKQFRSASEPVPGNYSRDFSWAVGNGWLAEADDVPGEYYVTGTGHAAVDAKFSKEIAEATGVAKRSRRRRSRKKEAET